MTTSPWPLSIASSSEGAFSGSTVRRSARNICPSTMWGDLNSDGVEDLVLSVRTAAAEGSMPQMRLLVATRSTASAPLRVLEWR
jgi:hypothetical protein